MNKKTYKGPVEVTAPVTAQEKQVLTDWVKQCCFESGDLYLTDDHGVTAKLDIGTAAGDDKNYNPQFTAPAGCLKLTVDAEGDQAAITKLVQEKLFRCGNPAHYILDIQPQQEQESTKEAGDKGGKVKARLTQRQAVKGTKSDGYAGGVRCVVVGIKEEDLNNAANWQ